MVVDVRGQDQLVGAGAGDELAHLRGDGRRAADKRHARALQRILGLGRIARPLGRRRRQLDWLAGAQAGERLAARRRQEARLVVGVGGDDVHAQHHVGPGQLRRRPEPAAIDLQRVEQHRRREVRRERERQAEPGGHLRAERARAEDPDRHVVPGAGDRADPLPGHRLAEEGHHLEHVVGEGVRIRVERAAQRHRRRRIGAGGAAQPQVDAAGKQRRQRRELLGHLQRRVIGQHDAAGADADARGPAGDVADQHRGGGAGDARHVVVLGQPEPVVAPAFGVPRQVERVVEGGPLCRPGRWARGRGRRAESSRRPHVVFEEERAGGGIEPVGPQGQ